MGLDILDQIFYHKLPVYRGTIGDLMADSRYFRAVPNNWHVIVTDIKNSTRAVSDGKHEIVNYLATGSIVTVLNVVYNIGIEIPFFFGGDGATFIVPPSVLEIVMRALQGYRAGTVIASGLELRIGSVPVKAIHENGDQLMLAKYRNSELFIIPVILGDGLAYAEKVTKGAGYIDVFAGLCDTPDLSGMQCRWDRIQPPKSQEEIVTLLVLTRDTTQQRQIFKWVLDGIDRIYGHPVHRHPISVPELRLKTTFKCVRLESKVRGKKHNFFSYLAAFADRVRTYLYFKTGEGKEYLQKLVALSDTLVIDGRINTVISGTKQQRQVLEDLLIKLESDGLIWYGLHISSASVMSCYVRNLDDGHVHFVDGAEGGYTNAAGFIKSKLRTTQSDA